MKRFYVGVALILTLMGGIVYADMIELKQSAGTIIKWVGDSLGNAMVSMGTLIACEDETNNLCMVSGGKVRGFSGNMMANVSTNTTGSPITGYTGSKTVKATLVCNAGGSTNCGITVTIYGSELNTQTAGTEQQLCQMIIPTGASTTTSTCPTITGSFLYMWGVTTGVAGTSPVLNVTTMY